MRPGCGQEKSSENRKKKLQTFKIVVKLVSESEDENADATDENAEGSITGSHSGTD